jgi:hypothetical protein
MNTLFHEKKACILPFNSIIDSIKVMLSYIAYIITYWKLIFLKFYF